MNNILVQTKNKGKDDDEAWKMEESTEAIFGDDTDSDDDTLRGVSNVVYRKEERPCYLLNPRHVQSVYSFTSGQLGVGATGPIREVINRCLLLVTS